MSSSSAIRADGTCASSRPRSCVTDGRAILHTRDSGGAIDLPVSRHHFGASWDRTVRSAQRLLDRLVADPDSRALLDRPEVLLDTVVAATRA